MCCASKSIVSSGATPSEVKNSEEKKKGMTQKNLDDYY
jgi:hypothetical protein